MIVWPVPGYFKTQDMCNEAVRINPLSLAFAPDYFKTEEMCKRIVKKNPCYLVHVPDKYKTEETCMEAVCIPPYELKPITDDFFKDLMKQGIDVCDGMTCYRVCMMFLVPDHLRTQEM